MSDPLATLLPLGFLGLGLPSESYGFPAKRHAWEVVAPLQARYSPLRTSHLRDPVGPQIHFASESFMDEVASATNTDPIDFRLKNAIVEGHKTIYGETFNRIGFVETLEAATDCCEDVADILQTVVVKNS